MGASGYSSELEEQIGQWRTYLRRRRSIRPVDVEELEDHLRDQIATLSGAGLADDEAFFVAVKRMGDLDALSREFAREYSGRLWKQLVVSGEEANAGRRKRTEPAVAILLALTAALAIKVPELLGLRTLEAHPEFYARNLSLFVFPILTGYFVWKRGLEGAIRYVYVLPFAGAIVFANAYPLGRESSTLLLTVLHLPIALWLTVGIAYAGGRWASGDGRMDFVRFSGELFIYYVLFALGGGVLTLFTVRIFDSIGMDAEWLAEGWLIPCGAMGACVIGAWLVEAKQSVIENMAPVLTRVFTPLFAAVLAVFIATMVLTGSVIDVRRDILIAFDLLLVLVLGLLLYAVSARDPEAAPNGFDTLQLVLVVSALAVDVVALAAIGARISEFGFSANKVAALGENLILLVNLGWSAWLYSGFVRGRRSFSALERWQTAYLPVYAVWAAIVVVAFPPLFEFS